MLAIKRCNKCGQELTLLFQWVFMIAFHIVKNFRLLAAISATGSSFVGD